MGDIKVQKSRHRMFTAELNFFGGSVDGSIPYHYVEEPPAGKLKENFKSHSQNVTIEDIRGREHGFDLDTHAFLPLQDVPTKVTPGFNDEEEIKQVYYPEIEKLILENVPGVKKAFIFDHTIRRSKPDSHRSPVFRVHIDQSIESTQQRIKLHLPDEAADLLKDRYRIINVWRPLNGPVQATPLALASGASVKPQVLTPIEHRYPTRTGQTVAVDYDPDLKWHYWSGMKNDEALLIKCSDSADVPGRGTPHSAFIDPRTPAGAPGRESIEVRVLVLG
ncbi:methyltransferase [Ascosphaera apis ARSEF 7405]|uniref:Methyltransferase n=1 Tax=Ascosphaera apis ARSEF 7405 TaxID=392613 RepID=A0A168AN67_9EURO|nr:methyltransferase [Ascosphaera apis ARSEF 7405]